MKKLLLPFLALVILSSCDKDETPECKPSVSTNEAKAYVIHEGNFGQANSEIGTWGLESNSYTHGLYETTNDEIMGDTFHSYYEEGDRIFWVINNSGKIIVTDRSFNKLGEISGLTSPRYILPITTELAYVTDLYSGVITVVNYQNYSISHTISVDVESTEKLFLSDSYAYAIGSTLVDSENWIYSYSVVKIDTASEEVEYIALDFSVNDASGDESGNIWLGASESDFSSTVYSFDPSTDAVEEVISNLTGTGISKIEVNNSNDIIYGLIDGDVYSIDPVNSSTTLMTDLDLGYGYGFKLDEFTNNIYVIDAGDFSSNGTAYRISAAGEILNEVETGIIPKAVFIP